MTENDILVLLTHGALCGLGVKANSASTLDRAKEAVDLARFTLGELKAAGVDFGANDAEAPANDVPLATADWKYDPQGAIDATQAKQLALEFFGKDLRTITTDLIQMFQRAAGLVVDGSPGPKTHEAYRYWINAG